MGITFFVNLHEKIILNGLHPKLKQVKQKEEIYFAIQHIFIKNILYFRNKICKKTY